MAYFPKALAYYKKALEINRDPKDKVALADDYRNFGIVYYQIGNYKQSLAYYKKALMIDTELNDKVALASNYFSMSFPLYGIKKRKKH